MTARFPFSTTFTNTQFRDWETAEWTPNPDGPPLCAVGILHGRIPLIDSTIVIRNCSYFLDLLCLPWYYWASFSSSSSFQVISPVALYMLTARWPRTVSNFPSPNVPSQLYLWNIKLPLIVELNHIVCVKNSAPKLILPLLSMLCLQLTRHLTLPLFDLQTTENKVLSDYVGFLKKKIFCLLICIEILKMFSQSFSYFTPL